MLVGMFVRAAHASDENGAPIEGTVVAVAFEQVRHPDGGFVVLVHCKDNRLRAVLAEGAEVQP